MYTEKLPSCSDTRTVRKRISKKPAFNELEDDRIWICVKFATYHPAVKLYKFLAKIVLIAQAFDVLAEVLFHRNKHRSSHQNENGHNGMQSEDDVVHVHALPAVRKDRAELGQLFDLLDVLEGRAEFRAVGRRPFGRHFARTTVGWPG